MSGRYYSIQMLSQKIGNFLTELENSMPELPELTLYAENLSKAVTGKKIITVQYHRQKRLNATAQELAAALVSSKIERIERVGKKICLHLGNGSAMCIHLMLSGGFVLTSDREVEHLNSLTLSIGFADGSAMAVTDPKGLVTVELNPKPGAQAPDALGVTAEYLRSKFGEQPKMLIKPFLINQELIGGIGNAYSDEILWRARISPKSVVGKLPPEAVKALVEAIPAVLNEALGELRKKRPDAVSGEERDFLKVHGPGRKVSPTGAPIIKEQIQTKTTYYTEEQRLYK